MTPTGPTIVFTPCYIFPSELGLYGLPQPAQQPDIMNLVQLASSLIDEACGRLDGDGNGSLVYTTYQQRILLQTRNRNLVQLPVHPITAVPQSMVNTLEAYGATGNPGLGVTGNVNYFDTGIQASTLIQANTGMLSGLLACSGRYGYTRQDGAIAYPDLFAFINPLNLVTIFGGPAPWIPMDCTQADYQVTTGEIWIPAGLQLQRYSEIWVTYNSGYNPLAMPPAIKQACCAMVKNALGRGGGTTGLLTMTMGRAGANATFMPKLIDPSVDLLLTPYKNVRAY
jgi:hypothetical protein